MVDIKNFSVAESDLAHIWQKTDSCIQEFSNANFFITGGTGFFGMWLLESLSYLNQVLKIKFSVTVLTRNIKKFLEKAPHFKNTSWLNFIEGDICSFAFPKDNPQFSHIIHAATEASAKLIREQPITMLDVTALGTRRVLEFAKVCRAKSVLLTSSGAVYGKQPEDLSHVPETYLGAPDVLSANSAYGVGKRYAEHLACLYAQEAGFEIKIARCFAFVGPYLPLDTHFAIGNFIGAVLNNNEAIDILGDGSPFRSYLYAADLVTWLWVILCKGESGRAYNLGSEDAIDIESLAKTVAQGHSQIKINIHQQRRENLKPARYVPDTSLAREALGLRQWVSLSDAIQRTVQWHQLK